MTAIVPVILCGGKGSRLWPLSRECHPKQFVDLGGGRSLFGDALERGRNIQGSTDPIVLTNERYGFFARDELGRHDARARIICEPEAKNTAPAIALGALGILEEWGGEDVLMLILPSDQVIGNRELFSASVEKAKSGALSDYIVTFGIYPTYPASAFGYMRIGRALGKSLFAVSSFVEKPSPEDAASMIKAGRHYWNAGIFLMRPGLYLRELERYRPDIYELCLAAWQKRSLKDGFEIPDREIFKQCASISIDYALMEKTGRAAIMPLNIPWKDLGSWDSFFSEAIKDTRGNAGMGNIVFKDCSNCQAYSQDRLVAALGVENLNIIATADAVLITKNGASEKIRELLQNLNSQRPYNDNYPQDCEEWGNYESLARGDHFRIRRLTVNPGQGLSLKRSHDRTRHLFVLCGKAEVRSGNKSRVYRENQVMLISPTDEYNIRNPGENPLIMIEIQSGNFREDE